MQVGSACNGNFIGIQKIYNYCMPHNYNQGEVGDNGQVKYMKEFLF